MNNTVDSPSKNGKNGVRFTYPVSVIAWDLAGRCAGRTPAKRWVLASTIARKSASQSTKVDYAAAMPNLPNTRHLRVGAAAALLAMAVAGCAHLPALVVPQAPAGAAGIVVFDVDGTLTPTVARIFSMRPDASAVVRLYAARGYRIVYLTARAPALQGTLRGFLSRHAFPPGDLLAPNRRAGHMAPAVFKARVLADYRAHGWDIAAAYGDSSSDFQAYARAAIPRDRVFALRRAGARDCQPGAWAACLTGWQGRYRALSTTP